VVIPAALHPGSAGKSDVAHVKADFFPVEFTADFWYLSVVTSANEHQLRPPTSYLYSYINLFLACLNPYDLGRRVRVSKVGVRIGVRIRIREEYI
jgi:hypothetical protein